MQDSKVDPLDEAAFTFMTGVKRTKQLTKALGGNAVVRVFNAIVEFPLADKEPKFLSKMEHELFVLTLSSLAAKNTMMSGYTKRMEDGLAGTEESTQTTVVSEEFNTTEV